VKPFPAHPLSVESVWEVPSKSERFIAVNLKPPPPSTLTKEDRGVTST
jgi:hypothetical protein